MNLNCYKCGTAEDLSIKARNRSGEVRTMVCKSCRRNIARRQPSTITKYETTQRNRYLQDYAADIERNKRLAMRTN